MTTYTDPFDDADNPQLRTLEYWGQMSVNAWYCVLEKGTGKVPFNAQQHAADRRVTALDFNLVPLADMNQTRNVERSVIAESKEYAGLVLPTIKALGITARDLNNRYVKLSFQKSGRTYIDKTTGETKDSTTLKFEKLFKDEAECRQDYLGNQYGAPVTDQSLPQAAPPPVNGGNGSKEKETALKFLKVVVQNAVSGQTDLNVIQNTVAVNIAQMPMIGKHFSADSLETTNLIMEAMAGK